jgi:hypothetical protein
MPEPIGSFFETQVPSYTEAADIRKAFNLYHYGSETVPTSEAGILPNSMAGYIRDTLAAIDAVVEGAAVISNLGALENLNDLAQTGVYHSTANPTTALGYPATTVGLLNFWLSSSNNTYYQTYITNASASTSNFYWRTGLKVQATLTWGEWQLVSKDGHTHDARYFTQSQINSKLNPTMSASKATVTDSAGRVTTLDTVTSAEVGTLAGISTASTIKDQLALKAAIDHVHTTYAALEHTHPTYWLKTETAKVTVSSSAPANPSVGDLWFW